MIFNLRIKKLDSEVSTLTPLYTFLMVYHTVANASRQAMIITIIVIQLLVAFCINDIPNEPVNNAMIGPKYVMI